MTDSGRNRHLWNSSGQTRCDREGYPEVASISWPMSPTMPLHSKASLGHTLLTAEQLYITLEQNAMLGCLRSVEPSALIIKSCKTEQSKKLHVKPI